MKKRLLAWVLAVLMVIGLLPPGQIIAGATETAKFLYTTSAQGATITGYTDKDVTRLIIPKVVDEYNVIAIAPNAFNYSDYRNLNDITVLGDNVDIGEKMCGFDNDSSRNNNLVLWGNKGSKLAAYAEAQLITFKTLATSVSDISTFGAEFFTGADAKEVQVTLTGDNTEDIIWESENEEQVVIKPFGTPEVQRDGTSLAKANVEVLSKGDGTCKIYAGARGLDTKKELELNLLQSATGIELEAAIYAREEQTVNGEKKYSYSKKSDVPSSFFENDVITLDEGYCLWIKPVVLGSEDDSADIFAQMGTASLVADENYPGDGSMYYAAKNTGNESVRITASSRSLIRQKNVDIRITKPAKALTMLMDGSAIQDGSAVRVIAGDKANMKAKLSPTDSTDTVTWSSSNTSVATISESGQITTHRSGTSVITCTVNDTPGSKRDMCQSFELVVAQKIPYNQLALSDTSGSKEAIETKELEAGTSFTLYPFDANPGEGLEPTEHVIYTSSNERIASVSNEGDKGVVRAVKDVAGSATITASVLRENGSNCTWTVVVNTYVKATSINIVSTTDIPEGQSKEYTYSLVPTAATEEIIWTSEDPTIAEVTSSESGKITIKANKVGNVRIQGRTKSNGAAVTIQVIVNTAIHINTMGIKVEDPNSYVSSYAADDNVIVYKVPINGSILLAPDCDPDNHNDALTWAAEAGYEDRVKLTKRADKLAVTVKAIGTTTFTLTSSSGKTALCRVEGIKQSTAVNIKNNGGSKITDLTIELNKTSIIKADLDPTGSTDSIVWTTDNNNVSLDVDKTKHGGLVTVTANATGNTVITATTDSGKTATLRVRVVIATTAVKLVDESTDEEVQSISILPAEEKNYRLVITPENTTDTTYTWSSKYSYVRLEAVDNGKSVKVTGIKPGTDTITVTSETGYVKTFTVTIIRTADSITLPTNFTSINKGDTKNITATISPTNSNDPITWSTDVDGVVELTPIPNNNKGISIKAVDVGTVTITATTRSGKTANLTLNVVTVDINSITMSAVNAGGYPYTGEAVKPPLTLKYGSYTLQEGTDFTVEYADNVNVTETATATYTGIGKYSGTKVVTYKIIRKGGCKAVFKETNATTRLNTEFTGFAIKPEVVVTSGETILTKGVDYNLSYYNGTNQNDDNVTDAGNKTIRVELINNYAGVVTLPYTITPKKIDGNSISITGYKTSYTYTGDKIEPVITITDGDRKVQLKYDKTNIADSDYACAYRDNVNVSTNGRNAILTITGRKNYSGSKTIEFKITPKSIASGTVQALPDQIYDGREKNLTAAVMFGDKRATVTCKCTNNINTGRATMTIKGTGNYTGTKVVYFKILPSNVVGLKQTSATASSVKLSWTKNPGGVSGYAIYRVKNGKYTYAGSTSGSSYTVKKLSAGNTYQFVVKAYKTVGSSKYYGKDYSSPINGLTSCGKPKMSSLRSTSAGTAVAKWKVTKGASKYIVYVSTNGKKYKKHSTPYATTVNLTGLRSKKYVYVKIKAVRVINGKEYLSGYSSVKKVKVK